MNIEDLREGLRYAEQHKFIRFALWVYDNKMIPLRFQRFEKVTGCVERTGTDEELMGLYARWILEKSNET